MARPIDLPRREGTVSRQAHADLPAGSFEREIGREGFFGAATHMYHRHPPTGWTEFEGALRPRAFDTSLLSEVPDLLWKNEPLLANAHLQIGYWSFRSPMPCLLRNADGDNLLFVHEGAGELYCDYGHLTLRDGDYVVLPRGTMWRIDTGGLDALVVEATNDAFSLPEKGIVGEHAIFDPGMLDTPRIDEAFIAQQTDDPWRVAVKRRGEVSTITFPFNPLDAMGWQGTLTPVRVNWRDIRPLMSHRYHLPPSAHSTFVASRFVVCTFCPRPMESDPGALKVPFFHSNDDYDEFLFYHRGEFFSRDNIHPGMITLHPGGFTHGPHPKALKTGLKATRKETDEVAVMIDARDPLEVRPRAQSIEQHEYVNSWKEQ